MKSLKTILAKKSGRSQGSLTVRHQGGREKRYLRNVDFKRDKFDVWGRVETIEYDPNRNAEIALVLYEDGERRYILAPDGLVIGQKIVSGPKAPVESGNALPLGKIPIGTGIHNLEVRAGKGGQMVKSAGAVASVQGKEDNWVLVKLPSGEVRRFDPKAFATIGQVGRIEFKTEKIGSAGRKRHMGVRPTVRGVAMHPHAHPHGGGEGRSHIGLKYPKTPYGKKAVGNTRKRRKYSDKLIVSGRSLGPHH
ncbi:50S ribosomal protein L2 [Candidatus Woesebacteria bacterium GWC1_42_13]|uniref:50S ribosomal protein L2 n=1 Tax=Candidatus Woesebacteria bacterium GWC1_42_13 TaxID=1802475 RepID=A0A1F7WUU4_9BACT|nr:MAG: 50S ribosomal protein L2 [Candidatus Woesebacteria bacterium GWC1_42_13]